MLVKLDLGVKRMSDLWPVPRVTVVVVYGTMSTKSLATMVTSWLSIEKYSIDPAPELIRRSL